MRLLQNGIQTLNSEVPLPRVHALLLPTLERMVLTDILFLELGNVQNSLDSFLERTSVHLLGPIATILERCLGAFSLRSLRTNAECRAA